MGSACNGNKNDDNNKMWIDAQDESYRYLELDLDGGVQDDCNTLEI